MQSIELLGDRELRGSMRGRYTLKAIQGGRYAGGGESGGVKLILIQSLHRTFCPYIVFLHQHRTGSEMSSPIMGLVHYVRKVDKHPLSPKKQQQQLVCPQDPAVFIQGVSLIGCSSVKFLH